MFIQAQPPFCSGASTLQWRIIRLLFLLSIQWCRPGFNLDSTSQESLPFLAHRNMYLPGYVIQSLRLDDWLQCLSACASTKACISYNFDSRLRICEVNSGGLTELRQECQEEKSLWFRQGLVFHQIRGKQKKKMFEE